MAMTTSLDNVKNRPTSVLTREEECLFQTALAMVLVKKRVRQQQQRQRQKDVQLQDKSHSKRAKIRHSTKTTNSSIHDCPHDDKEELALPLELELKPPEHEKCSILDDVFGTRRTRATTTTTTGRLLSRHYPEHMTHLFATACRISDQSQTLSDTHSQVPPALAGIVRHLLEQLLVWILPPNHNHNHNHNNNNNNNKMKISSSPDTPAPATSVVMVTPTTTKKKTRGNNNNNNNIKPKTTRRSPIVAATTPQAEDYSSPVTQVQVQMQRQVQIQAWMKETLLSHPQAGRIHQYLILECCRDRTRRDDNDNDDESCVRGNHTMSNSRFALVECWWQVLVTLLVDIAHDGLWGVLGVAMPPPSLLLASKTSHHHHNHQDDEDATTAPQVSSFLMRDLLDRVVSVDHLAVSLLRVLETLSVTSQTSYQLYSYHETTEKDRESTRTNTLSSSSSSSYPNKIHPRLHQVLTPLPTPNNLPVLLFALSGGGSPTIYAQTQSLERLDIGGQVLLRLGLAKVLLFGGDEP